MLLFLTIASGLALFRHVIELFGKRDTESNEKGTIGGGAVEDQPMLEREKGKPVKNDTVSIGQDQESVGDKTSQCRSPCEDVPSLQHSESTQSLSDVDDGPATPPSTPLDSCPFSQLVSQDVQKAVDPPRQGLTTTKEGYEVDDMWWVYKGDKVYLDARGWDVAKDRQIRAACEGYWYYTFEPTWAEWGLSVIDYLSWSAVWILVVDYCLRYLWCQMDASGENIWIVIRMVVIYSFVLIGPMLAVGFP